MDIMTCNKVTNYTITLSEHCKCNHNLRQYLWFMQLFGVLESVKNKLMQQYNPFLVTAYLL